MAARQLQEMGRASGDALPVGLTRRDLLGAAVLVAGTGALGLLPTPVRASPRFPGADQVDAEVATAWFDLALELVQRTPGFSPPVASRALAYTGLTLYESLVPGMDGFRSLGDLLAGSPPFPVAGRSAAYDWEVVANAAIASILRRLFPTMPAELRAAIDGLETRFLNSSRAGTPPGMLARSVRRGEDVAALVFEGSKYDGGHEGFLRNFPSHEPPVGAGLWEPTPPEFLPALQPFWGGNRCLALASSAAHLPGDHPPYSEDPTSPFWAEALEVYAVVDGRTDEQDAIARFWSDDPGLTPTPPGHSISITTQVLRNEASSLQTAAETYARVGIAVCDAFIACWHQKYVYNLVRPVTYLRRLVDETWLPPLVTPPFPEYPSGHSVQSGAAFLVLSDLFGDGYAFVDHTHDERGLSPRSYGSFLEAAEEAAISRLYGGIHFRAAIDNGLEQGRQIGQAVSALPLRG